MSTSSPTHAQGIELVAVAIAIARRDAHATTVVNLAWTVADAARIQRAHTFVHVVANAVLIKVLSTSSPAHAQSVKLVATAIAVARRDVCAAAVVNLTRTVAYAAGVQRAHAFIQVVANAVLVEVLSATPSADTQGVELIAVAVAIANGQLNTATFKNGARPGTHAAFVHITNATIAHPVPIQILGTTDRQEALVQGHAGHILVGSVGQNDP